MPIEYVTGNLLEDPGDYLVNAVNTRGVMGAGIAKQFREQYPKMYIEYRNLCSKKDAIGPGKIHRYDLPNGQVILNAFTKDHWKQPSQLWWVEQCLDYIYQIVEFRGMVGRGTHELSVALPALGCGYGGLEWEQVKACIDRLFADAQATYRVYLPQ